MLIISISCSNELVFIKQTNKQEKIPTTEKLMCPRLGQLLWQGPEAKIVLTLFSLVLSLKQTPNPPTHPPRQLSQLLTCTSHLVACVCAVSVSYIRRSRSVFSNTRTVSREFSSMGEQKGIWLWRMSSNCLSFKGLCHNIDLFGS